MAAQLGVFYATMYDRLIQIDGDRRANWSMWDVNTINVKYEERETSLLLPDAPDDAKYLVEIHCTRQFAEDDSVISILKRTGGYYHSIDVSVSITSNTTAFKQCYLSCICDPGEAIAFVPDEGTFGDASLNNIKITRLV